MCRLCSPNIVAADPALDATTIEDPDAPSSFHQAWQAEFCGLLSNKPDFVGVSNCVLKLYDCTPGAPPAVEDRAASGYSGFTSVDIHA